MKIFHLERKKKFLSNQQYCPFYLLPPLKKKKYIYIYIYYWGKFLGPDHLVESVKNYNICMCFDKMLHML
jgi:hypothetical protein